MANILKLFGRNKEVLRIERASAARAKFESEEIQRIDLTLKVEGNNVLMLEITPDAARELIEQMTCAYEAIRPPLHRGAGRMADWRGMDDN